jgi:holo-[acyl-carrier protein] synthase
MSAGLQQRNKGCIEKYLIRATFYSAEMNAAKKLGIGVDIENISRFRKLDVDADSAFLEKVFTQNEADYCFSKKNPAPHLAVRYACKEAIIKALANIGKSSVDYNKIRIFYNSEGVPKAKINKKGLGNVEVSISLSHCDDKAIAFAVIVETNKNG